MDIDKIPFSRKGSYCVISKLDDKLYLRSVRGGAERNNGCVLEIELLDQARNPIPYEVVFEETLLTCLYESSKLEICFCKENYVRLVSDGILVKFLLVTGDYNHVNKLKDNLFAIHSASTETKFLLSLLSGSAEEHKVWNKTRHDRAEFICTAVNGVLDIAIEDYVVVPSISNLEECSFHDYKQQVRESYDEWYQTVLSNPHQEYDACHKLASYITWSSYVRASGRLPHDAMYMSKNWMANIWSWDHCFNALAMATHRPEDAYVQFMFFREFQDASGALPDYINDAYVSYSCVKPPVHGWTYMKLLECNEFFADYTRLKDAYDMLGNMYFFWMRFRKDEDTGLPYYAHGNDSGWDDATVFTHGGNVIAPDLTSYLILTCDALSTIASLIDFKKDAEFWKGEADRFLWLLLRYLYDDDIGFYSVDMYTREIIESKSLINMMPIVIGDRLPADVLDKLLGKLLSTDFFTQYGFATEAITSDLYESRGYWRGPIWAPVTLLITDGLLRSGKKTESEEVVRRFLELTSVGGMAENFDALSGTGLNDCAFTWTSSVFLLLIHQYVGEHI